MAGSRTCGVETANGKSVLDGTSVRACSSLPGVVSSRPAAEPLPGLQSLTAYFGGAGMSGPYIADQIAAFREAGIKNPVAGSFSMGLPHDAGISSRYLRDRYKYQMGFQDSFPYAPYKIEFDWSLKTLGINVPPPKNGPPFNLVGYSYGSLVAAQSAIFYANKGYRISFLVLIASTISTAFLKELMDAPEILRLTSITINEDDIKPGISTWQIIEDLPKLGRDVTKTGAGHFYFSGDDAVGRKRRRDLARMLYNEGMR